MALVLVRLKLALLRGSLRRARVEGIVGIVMAAAVTLTIGLGGALLFASVRVASAEVASGVALGAFSLLFFVWVLGPIITAASDGTLPPERLAPFPLRAVTLMPGLLLASAVGFGGACTAIVLAGAVAGLAPIGPGAVVTVAAVVAELAVCVIFSRLLATAVSSAVRRRRTRDLALAVGPLIALGLNLGLQVLLRATVNPTVPREPNFELWRSIRPFLAVLPSGPPALAAGLAREGRVGMACAALALAVGYALVGLALWHRALQRALTTAGGGSSGGGGRSRSLFPWFARPLPRNRAGAVAARELRLTWRDPRQRAALFGSIFAPVLLIFSLRTLDSVEPGIVLLGVAPALFIGIGSANLWGYDGRAAWTDAIAPGDRRDDVIGKVLARAFLALLMSAVAITGLAIRVRSGARVGEAVGLAVGAFGLVTGVAVILAVRNPYPMPESRTNVFSSGTSGQGFGQAGVALGLLFASTIVVVPVGALLADVHATLVRASIAVAVAIVGTLVLAFGVNAAGAHLRERGPEVLSKLVPERA